MIEQIRRCSKALAAKLALVVALASVHAAVDDERILAGKRLAAKFTLVLAHSRVQ